MTFEREGGKCRAAFEREMLAREDSLLPTVAPPSPRGLVPTRACVSRAFSFPLLVPGHHKDKKESKRAGKDAKVSAGAARTRVPCARPVRTTHVRVAADGQQDVH